MNSQILKKKKKKKKEWWNCGITNTNIFPKKKLLTGEKNFSWRKTQGEVVLNWRTNDQIMPRFRRSFIINDKLNAFSSRSNLNTKSHTWGIDILFEKLTSETLG